MEEENDTAEEILTFDAVGNWRTIKNDNDEYEKVFVPGIDVQRVLKSILRDIRDENEEYRDYSMKMKKYSIPETRLIPLFVSASDKSILVTLLKIFVCYTLPIKKDDSCYSVLRIGYLRFLESFISNNAFSVLLSLVSENVASDFFDRDNTQLLQIDLFLTFIRNLCCIENYNEDSKSAYSHIHETLIKAMYDEMIIEMLTILSVEEQSKYHWMILEIFCLMINGANPKDVFDSIHAKTNPSSNSSLRSLLNSELQKKQFYESQLPSSFSDSYNITSVNRFVTQGHKVESLHYQPRTYIPRRAKQFILQQNNTFSSMYLKPLFTSMLFIINSCYNEYIHILQRYIRKKNDLIPSDYQNYLLFTSFCNRFAYLFITNPSPIQSEEDELKPLTIESVAQSTTQEFLVYCLELCKKLNLEEIQWSEMTPVFANLSSLFDIYCALLTKKGKEWNSIKYKTEIIVNTVMTQVTSIQLLPDILLKWKAKVGFHPFFALITSINSLLHLCEVLRERGTMLLKRKKVKSSVEYNEQDEEVTTIEYSEISFNLNFLINLLYRPKITEKYIFMLYHYKFLTEELNECLYYYFQYLFDYVDETPNLTNDVEYNDRHQDELKHTLRPRLFNVQFFEILNRILHDPAVFAPKSPHNTARRLDIEHLGSLAKTVFDLFITQASKYPVLYAEALFSMKPSTVSLISRGYRANESASSTVVMSSSVLDGSVTLGQEEVDISKLPDAPDIPVDPEKAKKRRSRRRRDEKVIQWSSSDDETPKRDLFGEEKEFDVDGPTEEKESEDEMVAPKRILRKSQADVRVVEDSSSTDDGGEESDLELTPASASAAPAVSVIRKRKIRSIVQLSSDEEEEEKDAQPHEWNEEDDTKLKTCFEEYKDMVDPWSMIVYDSYFMERKQSKDVILKRAHELGLRSEDSKEDEEVTQPKRRHIIVDDSDSYFC